MRMGFGTVSALLVAFGLAGAQVTPLAAQTPDREAQSMVAAALSYRAWHSGDRATAIVEALRGLPHEPDAEDIARFSGAWDALRLAVVSRSFRIPFEGNGIFYAVTDPTGRVTATVSSWVDIEDQPRLGLNLWAPQTGLHIAEVIPRAAIANGVSDSGPPVFSPDGSLVALTAPFTGQTHVFDTHSGSEVTLAGK